MEKSILRIELVQEKPMGNDCHYHNLDLPAEEHEIRDAFQKARITSEGFGDICITNSSLPFLRDIRLDSPTVEELNFLAKRIQAMDAVTQLTYGAVIQKTVDLEEVVSMKDLINCTYGLDEVPVAADVTNDAELGQFILDNKLHEDVNGVPAEARYLLDHRKIGEMYRTTFGTVYMGGLCVFAGDYEIPEVYNGQQLPEPPFSTGYAFRFRIGDGSPGKTKWVSLPVERKEADRIAAQYGKSRIEDCVHYSFESAVPQITRQIAGGMGNFDKLNQLAASVMEMSSTEQIKFKAALSAEKPVEIDQILDVASHLHQYEIDAGVFSEGDYFKRCLAHHLDSYFDKSWLDTLRVDEEGRQMLQGMGGKVTDYGVISARGQSLYGMAPNCTEDMDVDSVLSEDEQEQVTGPQFGGM